MSNSDLFTCTNYRVIYLLMFAYIFADRSAPSRLLRMQGALLLLRSMEGQVQLSRVHQ